MEVAFRGDLFWLPTRLVGLVRRVEQVPDGLLEIAWPSGHSCGRRAGRLSLRCFAHRSNRLRSLCSFGGVGHHTHTLSSGADWVDELVSPVTGPRHGGPPADAEIASNFNMETSTPRKSCECQAVSPRPLPRSFRAALHQGGEIRRSLPAAMFFQGQLRNLCCSRESVRHLPNRLITSVRD